MKSIKAEGVKLSAMAETMERQKEIVISPRMVDVLRHMLEKPRATYYTGGLCADLGLPSGTVRPIVQKMMDADWIYGAWEPRPLPRRQRWLFKFTPGSSALARKAIKGR